MNRLLITGVLVVIFNSFEIPQPDKDYLNKKRLLWEIDSLQKRRQIDSLQIVIKIRKEDTMLVKDLYLLSHSYHENLILDSGLMYARRTIRLAEKLKYPYGLMMGYKYMSGIFYNQKNYDSSIFYTRKGLNICIANNFYSEEMDLFRIGLNHIFFLQGNYTEAMKIWCNNCFYYSLSSNKYNI
jgi:hypothetical protein